MATSDSFRSAPLRATSGGFFSRMIAIFAAWNDARSTRNALGKLTDQELDDIGLSRADIYQISETSFARR